MKRMIAVMATFLLMISLAACGGPADASEQENRASTPASESHPASIPAGSASTPESGPGPEDSSSAATEEPALPASSSPAEPEPAASSEPEAEEGKVLIAYFTRTGNTRQIAELIQEQTGGDLFQIETERSYSGDYDTVLDEASKEQSENARPALSGSIENMGDYDTVFIGYPIWWSDTPMAVLTFLESYDFSGKTVVPFCTHGGGGSGRSFSSVSGSAAGATVLEGFSIAGSSAEGAQEQVSDWLEGLNISM